MPARHLSTQPTSVCYPRERVPPNMGESVQARVLVIPFLLRDRQKAAKVVMRNCHMVEVGWFSENYSGVRARVMAAASASIQRGSHWETRIQVKACKRG